MKAFEYSDREIGKREMKISIASMLIGTGVLTLPQMLASHSNGIDAWVSLLASGLLSMFFCWVCAKLATRFPKQTFLQYTSAIVSKPAAIVLTLVYSVYSLLTAASATRDLSNIAKLYLFDRTPIEMIALVFLLPVTYAVAGPSVGVLRLNILFFPIVIVVIAIVLFLDLQFIETRNFLPVFTTDWQGYAEGVLSSGYSYLGYGIILIYAAMLNRPEDGPKAAITGVAIPMILYIAIYISVIGILNNAAAANIMYPTIEVAKEVQVPGQFFERLESLFFTTWIMTIFNTAAMALDVAVVTAGYVFPKWKKIIWALILTPAVFLISMLPQSAVELRQFQEWFNYFAMFLNGPLPILLLLIAKVRRAKGNG